jgi:hypothetical protein
MLRAYFDAGLKLKPHRVFYIAGYVGFSKDWTLFDRKWRDLLRRNDLPYFHMTDYVARQGRYREWSEAKRLAVMRRIVALASETTRMGIGATLLPDHYERLSQNDRELLPDSYGLCVTACIAKTARTLQRARIAEHVDYVFESGDAGQGTTKLLLEQLFAKSTRREQYAFHSLRFEPKAKFPGLQLADIFAFETGRYVPFALGWDASPERKCFQELRNGNKHYAMIFDFEELTKLASSRRAALESKGNADQRGPAP